MHAAIPSCGKDVLVILDGQVIGKGHIVTRYADKITSIRFTEGEIVEMVKELPIVKAIGMGHSYFKYLPFTGFYFGSDEMTGPGGDEILSRTMVVDEFYFSYGMVPEHFHGVPGFRSAIDEIN